MVFIHQVGVSGFDSQLVLDNLKFILKRTDFMKEVTKNLTIPLSKELLESPTTSINLLGRIPMVIHPLGLKNNTLEIRVG